MRITADWLDAPSIQKIFDAVECGDDTARVVGGAVRNSLLGAAVKDVDIATTATPDVVVERCTAAGLKVIPTGIDHGTVTAMSGGQGYELTTLRQDVETFGRQATVSFGRDWTEDARRRDFTLNALYCDRNGEIFDPLGGLEDCLSRRVHFIGDPHQRIREDYLRILRFFRIHATYGAGDPDPAGLLACVQERDGLRNLSAERVGTEMVRLVTAPLAAKVVALMESHGILEIVTGGVARVVDFTAFHALADVAPEIADAPLALVALAGFVEEDVDRLVDRLRLSNADRKRMQLALSAAQALRGKQTTEPIHLPDLLFRFGRCGAVDGFLLDWASSGEAALDPERGRLFTDLRKLEVPEFPVLGRDLIALGIQPGPELGELLARLQSRWQASEFSLSKAELLAAIDRPH